MPSRVPNVRGAAAAALLVAVLAFSGAACTEERQVVRIGILVDCTGLIGQSREMSLAAAALPLLQRGGELAAGGVTYGARGARIGGREVELVPDCTELTYAHLLIAGARRLLEEQRVDILVGPIGTPEGVVLRDIAKRYPDAVFLSGASLAQEATLHDPQPNLYRFALDGPQTVAGLGEYAFRDLGWRRAVVVAEGYNEGYELAAGFVAEFCALGGEIVERDFTAFFTPDPTAAAQRHATADGVALFANYFPVAPYLGAYAKQAQPLGRRLVVGGASFADQANLAVPGIDLTGVVLGSSVPLDRGVASMDAYRDAFSAAFPAFPPGIAEGPSILPSYNAVEAVARALESAGADLDRDPTAFRTALARNVLAAPQGPLRLDANRQAMGRTYLERIARVADRKATLTGVRTLDGIEQGFGGIFTSSTPPPSATEPACERRALPLWAR